MLRVVEYFFGACTGTNHVIFRLATLANTFFGSIYFYSLCVMLAFFPSKPTIVQSSVFIHVYIDARTVVAVSVCLSSPCFLCTVPF